MRHKGSFGVYVVAIAVALGILFLVVALDRAVTDKWAYKKIADKQTTTIKELNAKVDMHSFNENLWSEGYIMAKKALIKQKKACDRNISNLNESCTKEIAFIKEKYTNKALFKRGDKVKTTSEYTTHFNEKIIYGTVIYEEDNGIVSFVINPKTNRNLLLHRMWLMLDDGSKEPVEEPNPFPFIWKNE